MQTQDAPTVQLAPRIGVFLLGMLTFAAVFKLATIPPVAVYGFGAMFFLLLAAVLFLVPVATSAATMTLGYPRSRGVYSWVEEAFGNRWAFFATWEQWIHHLLVAPLLISYITSLLAFVVSPQLAQSPVYVFLSVTAVIWLTTEWNTLKVDDNARVATVGAIVSAVIPAMILLPLSIAYLTTGGVSHWSFGGPSTWFAGGLSSLAVIVPAFLAFGSFEDTGPFVRDAKEGPRTYGRALVLAGFATVAVVLAVTFAAGVATPATSITLLTGIPQTISALLNYFGLGFLLTPMLVLMGVGAAASRTSFMYGPAHTVVTAVDREQLPARLGKVNGNGSPVNLLVIQGVFMTLIATIFVILPSINDAFNVIVVASVQSYLGMYLLMFLSVRRLLKEHRTTRFPHLSNASVRVRRGAALAGTITAVTVFAIGFIPPPDIVPFTIRGYELTLLAAILIIVAVPLLVPQTSPHVLARVERERLQDLRQVLRHQTQRAQLAKAEPTVAGPEPETNPGVTVDGSSVVQSGNELPNGRRHRGRRAGFTTGSRRGSAPHETTGRRSESDEERLVLHPGTGR